MEEVLAPPFVDQLESACQAREKFAVSLYDKSSAIAERSSVSQHISKGFVC